MKRVLSFAVFALAAALPLAAQQYRRPMPNSNPPGRDAMAYVEELAGQVNVKLNQVQDENAMLETKIMDLEQQVRSMAEINQRLVRQVAELEKRLAASESTYDGQFRKILSQMDKIDSRPIPPPPALPRGSGQNALPGEYEIYEVQAGATLSVISQAYGVPVRDIKRANNLKNDNIYVGQKLKIPVSR